MNEEFSCRICRGEATDQQPLLHPCKCKGSIRYIHQDCLLEWLKHSNKSLEQCDICHTTYKFETIYDSETPNMVPVRLIGAKLLRVVRSTIHKFTAISLFIWCLGFLVPVTWKIVGRLVNMVIDGHYPASNKTFLDAVFFGEFDIRGHISARLLADPNISIILERLSVFLQYTFLSGLRYIVFSIILWIVLFLEHEWVTKDEIYTKMLNRRIGKERKATFMDLLNKQVQEGELGVNENIEFMANLQDAQQERVDTMEFLGENHVLEGRDRRLHLDRTDRDVNLEDGTDRRHILNRTDRDAAIEDFFGRNQDDDELGYESDGSFDEEFDNLLDRLEHVHDVRDVPVVRLPPVQDPAAAAEDAALALRVAREADAAEAAELAANNLNNDNGWFAEFLALWGLEMSITAPLALMFFADAFILVFIIVAYFFPHLLGTLTASIAGLVFKISFKLTAWWWNSLQKGYLSVSIWKLTDYLFTKIWKPIGYLFPSIRKLTGYLPEITLHPHIQTLSITINQYILKPSANSFTNIFLGPNPPVRSLLERFAFVGLGYGLVFGLLYQLMRGISSRGKPVTGSLRYVYTLLFELFSTLKVFVVFSIEIVLFPVYCGWLLDFCTGPILLEQFTTQVIINGVPTTTFLPLFTLHFESFQQSYVRFFIYWFVGTLYMFCLSLFVGMTRSKILRPGVLFFIRSPDDPDTKLIREAMVKPLAWQLSRIYLSGKFYLLFIIFGLGGVSWGVRYLVSKFASRVFLPLQLPPAILYVVFPPFLALASRVKYDSIAKYGHMYWKKAFELAAHKLRLSHFILGRPISQERGHIVYRSLFLQFLGVEKPDYTKPVSYRDALAVFKEDPSVNACFVPDGSFVRAPDSDLSRRFVKHVFVAVTKDDQLIEEQPIPEPTPHEEHEDFLDDDDEIDPNDNGYSVVYRPPNFKMRCVGLILLLWVFGTLLISGIFSTAVVLGRPVITAACIVFDQSFDARFIDLGSIGFGLCMLVIGLEVYEKRSNELRTEVANPRVAQPAAPAAVPPIVAPPIVAPVAAVPAFVRPAPVRANAPIPIARQRNIIMYFAALPVWIVWAVLAHSAISISWHANGRDFNILLALLHFIMMPWTAIPIWKMISPNRAFNHNVLDDLGLRQLLARLVIIILLSIMYYFVASSYAFDKWHAPGLAFATFMAGDLIRAGVRGYKWLNEVVKNEVYARRRSLVNID